MFVTAEDGADVAFGAGEINLRDKDGAVGEGGAAFPFEDVAFQKFFKIPRAGEGVGGGVEEVFRTKGGDALGIGPISGGGGWDNLHEADFTAGAAGAGVETAFAPDNGFDKRGVNRVTAGGGEDGSVLAVVAPLIPPPI